MIHNNRALPAAGYVALPKIQEAVVALRQNSNDRRDNNNGVGVKKSNATFRQIVRGCINQRTEPCFTQNLGKIFQLRLGVFHGDLEEGLVVEILKILFGTQKVPKLLAFCHIVE